MKRSCLLFLLATIVSLPCFSKAPEKVRKEKILAVILLAVPAISLAVLVGHSVLNNRTNEENVNTDSDQGYQAAVNSDEDLEVSDSSIEPDITSDCKNKNNRAFDIKARPEPYLQSQYRANNCLSEALVLSNNPQMSRDQSRLMGQLARKYIVENSGLDEPYGDDEQLRFDGVTLNKLTKFLGINSNVVVKGGVSGVTKYINPNAASDDDTIYLRNEGYNHFVPDTEPPVPVEPSVFWYPGCEDFEINYEQYPELSVDDDHWEELELRELREAERLSLLEYTL